MPFGQLLTTLSAVNGAVGSPVQETLDFSDNLYGGSPIINFFNWAFNITSDNTKEQNLGEIGTTTPQYNSSTPNYPENHNADSLSIMWYLASFGTLVMFFLLISFSEVCCKKSLTLPPEDESETSPPPPYDLFAPPAYDSLYEGKKEKNRKMKKKRKCEVFVINVFGDKNALRVPPSETVQRNDSEREPR